MRNNDFLPLRRLRVINTGLNLPAPLAAAQLAGLGAQATKVEPPTGDPLAQYCRPWYEALHAGVEMRRLDLKSAAGRGEMARLLANADILITAQRPPALARMGLDPEIIINDYTKLAIVNIVGASGAQAGAPGHDLTYQAAAGLLQPPALPRSLLADLGGAQQATIMALALHAGGGGAQEVALCDAARFFQAPLAFGLTGPGGLLGGGHAGYRFYRSSDGWLALAALEPHFWQRLCEHIAGLPANPLDPAAHAALAAAFAVYPTPHWQAWAQEHDIPIEVVSY